jgi:hypothetical protein
MNPPENKSSAARGTRPDAETADAIVLIKNVSALRATYQIRLLAYKAGQTGKKLILLVPASCRFDPGLQTLIDSMPQSIRRENLQTP